MDTVHTHTHTPPGVQHGLQVRAGTMTRQTKVLAAKTDSLSLISEPHTVEEENRLKKLSSDFYNKQINILKNKLKRKRRDCEMNLVTYAHNPST